MFIRKIRKKNGRTEKIYETLHLVESVRTLSGPRQRLILNLGNLYIDKSQFTAFARRIEDILTGQKSFNKIDDQLEKYAKEASRKLFQKKAETKSFGKESNFQHVDINSLGITEPRSLGPEFICNSIWSELSLDKIFTQNNVPDNTLSIIKALVIGRLIEPNSERQTKEWAENRSSIYELIGFPQQKSLNSYYRANDIIFSLKDSLEKHLTMKEKDIFSLEETTFFFDLTNTYFEGTASGNKKAHRGHSKEKRNDCKLVTLGLIIDSNGFAKYSKLFPGNQAESKTLIGMIEEMDGEFIPNIAKINHKKNISKSRTIVMDAGIATQENINILSKSNYHYIAVNRGNHPFEEDFSDMQVIREDVTQGIKVEIKRFTVNNETFILCRSKKKKLKETGIREKFEKLLIEKLQYYKEGLSLPKRLKNYEKLLENIGRLKEKYSRAAILYQIEVISENKKGLSSSKMKAIDIVWKKKEDLYTKKIENEGVYVIRTSRTDLSDKEIWETYVMLTRIENAFKNMKSSLGFRPIFHHLENRTDAHLFISVLAYHILHIIEARLRSNGDNRNWSTIREIMKTHQRGTISFITKDKKGIKKQQMVRLNTTMEEEHRKIYKNLNISVRRLPKNKINIQQT